jgi:hypothetical protein
MKLKSRAKDGVSKGWLSFRDSGKGDLPSIFVKNGWLRPRVCDQMGILLKNPPVMGSFVVVFDQGGGQEFFYIPPQSISNTSWDFASIPRGCASAHPPTFFW